MHSHECSTVCTGACRLQLVRQTHIDSRGPATRYGHYRVWPPDTARVFSVFAKPSGAVQPQVTSKIETLSLVQENNRERERNLPPQHTHTAQHISSAHGCTPDTGRRIFGGWGEKATHTLQQRCHTACHTARARCGTAEDTSHQRDKKGTKTDISCFSERRTNNEGTA